MNHMRLPGERLLWLVTHVDQLASKLGYLTNQKVLVGNTVASGPVWMPPCSGPVWLPPCSVYLLGYFPACLLGFCPACLLGLPVCLTVHLPSWLPACLASYLPVFSVAGGCDSGYGGGGGGGPNKTVWPDWTVRAWLSSWPKLVRHYIINEQQLWPLNTPHPWRIFTHGPPYTCLPGLLHPMALYLRCLTLWHPEGWPYPILLGLFLGQSYRFLTSPLSIVITELYLD